MALTPWFARDSAVSMAHRLIAVLRRGAQDLCRIDTNHAVPQLWHYPPLSKRMPSMKPEDLERLVTQTMPYGKYKGRLIADLPGNYLNWFARVGFPRGDIGQLLALMQEIDHNGLSALLDPLRRR